VLANKKGEAMGERKEGETGMVRGTAWVSL
jgi:hypothetical protein